MYTKMDINYLRSQIEKALTHSVEKGVIMLNVHFSEISLTEEDIDSLEKEYNIIFRGIGDRLCIQPDCEIVSKKSI